MEEVIRKKYIPMTETIYYTLLSVTVPRHGYAIMQYVSELTKGRVTLGTGTLYTMVGRLTADKVIAIVPGYDKKVYLITNMGMELLRMETERLGKQLADGSKVLELLHPVQEAVGKFPGADADLQNGGGTLDESGISMCCGKYLGNDEPI